jgi:hypothetical protein
VPKPSQVLRFVAVALLFLAVAVGTAAIGVPYFRGKRQVAQESTAPTLRITNQQAAPKAEAVIRGRDQKIEARTIPKEQFDRLAAALRASPVKGPVTVAWVIGSAEALAFGYQLKYTLEAGGWTVPDTTIMADVSGFGTAIVVRRAAVAPPHAAHLQQALQSAGLEVDALERPWVLDGAVQLLVFKQR